MLNKKFKILIVDDQIEALKSLEFLFEEFGYMVTLVDNGVKALQILKSSYFDVVLMDINMPGINGVETYKEVKKISPSTVVIMMTGAAPEDLIREAIEEGAYTVLYKPFAINKVLDTLDEALKKPIVLVVDDRMDNRIIVRNTLSDKYRVVEAHDGFDAVEKVGKGKYDVVLLDYRMPGMDGPKTMDEMKKRNPDIPVIMMTAYDLDDIVKEEIMKRGAYTI